MKPLPLILVVILVAGPPGDQQPKSCRQLRAWTEKCRLGPCHVREIEAWRERCKRDTQHQQGSAG